MERILQLYIYIFFRSDSNRFIVDDKQNADTVYE